MQQTITYYSMLQNAKEIKPPVKIKLSRCETRLLDSGNLSVSMKWVEDQVASYFFPGLAPGQADSQPGISFKYEQIKTLSKEDKGVLITIEWEA